VTKPSPFAHLEFDVADFWERFGKEIKIAKPVLSRTESTGPVFLYVLITRRSSVQICPAQPILLRWTRQATSCWSKIFASRTFDSCRLPRRSVSAFMRQILKTKNGFKTGSRKPRLRTAVTKRTEAGRHPQNAQGKTLFWFNTATFGTSLSVASRFLDSSS